MNAAEYRAWWETNAPVPYGFCWCACGGRTGIAARSFPDRGWVAGEPRRFIRGHQARKTNAADQAEICRRYRAGEKLALIAEDYGIAVGTVSKILKDNGVSELNEEARSFTPAEYRAWWEANTSVPFGYCWCGCGGKTNVARQSDLSRNVLKGEPNRFLHGHLNSGRAAWATDEQKEEIIRRYLAGEGSYALGREFGVSGSNLGKMLDQRGIKRRSLSETKRVHSCDHAFFDAIDSEEKAYWLGFMAADGNVVTGRPILKLALASKDRDHLLKFRDALHSAHAITDYVTKTGHSGAKFSLASPQLTEGLAKHGISPNKTFTVEWPNNLASHLLPHYLRGYFDGDGSFHVKRRPTNAPVLRWEIVGNEAFCLGAQGYMMQALGVGKTKLYVPKNSPNIRKLVYGGSRQVARIFNLMYDGATIYLPRKHDKVAHLL